MQEIGVHRGKRNYLLSLGASMWFWSVSLADQLSGQFLISFGWPKENCPVSETGQLVGQETDQNHMDVPFLGSLTIQVKSLTISIGKCALEAYLITVLKTLIVNRACGFLATCLVRLEVI